MEVMKNNNGVLLPAIDLLLLIIITLLVSFFSIQYSEKGVGEKGFLKVESVVPDTEAFLRSSSNSPFVSIILNGNTIEMWQVINPGKSVQIGTYSSLEEFSKYISKDQTYIIYETKVSNLVGDVLRSLFKAGVSSVQIAELHAH
jgi:hypothetical protein